MIWVNYFGAVSHLRCYLHPTWWLSRAIVLLPLASIDMIKNTWAVVQVRAELSLCQRPAHDHGQQRTLGGVWAEKSLCPLAPPLASGLHIHLIPPASSQTFHCHNTLCQWASLFQFSLYEKSTTLFGFQPAARYLHLVPCWTC